MNKHILWIKAKCLDYYKFIASLNKIRVKILEIKYINKNVYLKLEEKEYLKIKKYLLSYDFEIIEELGLYKIKSLIKKYQVLLICLIIGFIIYLFITNLIVEVNIIHENKEIRELLKDELKEYGIKSLSLKKSYKRLQEIKKEILDKYPKKIDWLEFEVDGMIYNVKVEERIITDLSKENKTCHIIALKDGVISGIKVYKGTIVVNLNDYVKKGDILVNGIITHNEEEKNKVCADAEIYANTWYTINVTIPLQYYEYEKTGEMKYNFVIKNNENKSKIFKNRFSLYESEYKTILKLFEYELWLEKEYETKKVVKKYNEEEALGKGIEKALENLEKNLKDKDTIIDKKVLKKSVIDSKMNIEVFVVVKELISKEQIFVDEGIDENDSQNN